ncbi:unnamed protein product [Acanthoscelides obtectus]|uniref:Uncharacterized protein n=1 Tax=Acanthoscelides obtectus TaxID=200917 RepID=A0A9P0K330_ACAOB|nr:unnamed protein product [Acanthoscelides obtectus]CAK1665920.1 hypothetical protein AOBTE_LOCUS25051 [Acanthoscelides obtectus]
MHRLQLFPTVFILLKQLVATEFCDSTPCKHESSQMLLMMKHDADPCEEFHELVCGGRSIMDDTTNSEHYHKVKKLLRGNLTLTPHLEAYKTFLESCENYYPELDYKENLRKLLTYINVDDLTEILSKLILSQSSPLFDIGLDIDVNQNYQFQLMPPSMESPIKITLTGLTVDEIVRKSCMEFVQSTITEPGVDIHDVFQAFNKCLEQTLEGYYMNFQKEVSYLSNTSSSANLLNTGELLEFLNAIQGIRPSPNEIRQDHLYKAIDPISISELKRRYDLVDWKKLFHNLGVDRTFNGNEMVQMSFLKYFDNLFNMLKMYNKTTLRQLLTEYHAFHLYLTIVLPPSINTENNCFNIANQLMPEVATSIAYSLVPTSLTGIWNDKIHKLFEGLKVVFDGSLEESRMDENSKQLLRDKLKMISLESAEFADYDILEKGGTNLKFGNDFVENLLYLLERYRKNVMSLYGKQATPTSILAYFVNAFDRRPKSYITTKFIAFHSASLHKSLLNMPEYLVFAQLGMELAQQLVRHFDRAGRKYFTGPGISSSDQFYKYIADQTNTFVTTFFLKDSYSFMGSTYSYQDVDISLLLDELMLDNAAFRLVHDYVKENTEFQSVPWASRTYSDEQLFFIAAAQQYCWETTDISFTLDILESRNLPSPLKIQNIVSNSAEFADVFSCPEGSAMRLDSSVITQFPKVEYYGDYTEE